MRRNHFIHNEYTDGKVNHIFGIFEMIGNLGASAINKDAQDDTNDLNEAIFNKQFDYTKERDKLADERYADETAYNRAFAEDERAYNRAFQEDNRAYTRALQQEIFDREDTALERQASSLSKMGINPLSANLTGLGAGQALTSPSPVASSAASAGAAQNNAQPSHPNLQAFTGWNFSGLEPSLEFMNQLDNLHTAGIQRDLLRQQENYQKLVNMSYANDNGIKLDEYGNPIGIDPTVTNQEIKRSEQEGRKQDNRSKKANANIDEREDDFQYHTGSHKSVSPVMQPAYDATWGAYRAATGIKSAYDSHVDNAKRESDSKIAKLQDRLADAGNTLLTNAINNFMKARKSISSFFRRKNNSITYGSIPDRSGRMR